MSELRKLFVHLLLRRKEAAHYRQIEDGVYRCDRNQRPKVVEFTVFDVELVSNKPTNVVREEVPNVYDRQDEAIESSLNIWWAHIARQDHDGHQVDSIYERVEPADYVSESYRGHNRLNNLTNYQQL